MALLEDHVSAINCSSALCERDRWQHMGRRKTLSRRPNLSSGCLVFGGLTQKLIDLLNPQERNYQICLIFKAEYSALFYNQSAGLQRGVRTSNHVLIITGVIIDSVRSDKMRSH